MKKYLIEVPHDEDVISCVQAVRIFLTSGSHFLANADWGCKDGDHKAWLVVEVNGKEEARRILPPAYRANAKIVELNKFTMDEMDEEMRVYHRRT
ncbi:MAG TPA: hypothetical protein ENO20_00805 [Bacteroides sp.]|nr:hypothetical protein [Bacteroides sp.]